MFDIESKKLRSSDIDFQKEIDSNIKDSLKKSKYNFYEIQSLNNRTQEILDYIKLKPNELNTVLFNMQMKGLVEKLAGNSYIALIKL